MILKMNKDELSLLLYLEARAVDYGGRVAQEKMNNDDRAIIAQWIKDGIVEFGRICIEDANYQGAAWVVLSEDAWTTAHAERRARADRMFKKRDFKTTKEKRECPYA